MDFDNLNKWSTLISNIAVIAGIVFLGYELNQNNENLAAQSRFNYREARAEGNLQNAHDPVFAGIIMKAMNGDELTPAEEFQAEAYIRYMFVNFEWSHGESLRGRSAIDANTIRQFFDTAPIAYEVWPRARYSYNSAFQDFIDNHVLQRQDQ